MTQRTAVSMLMLVTLLLPACGRGADAPPLEEVKRARAGSVDVVLLSADGTVQRSGGTFAIEFRSPDGALADVGDVTANVTMPMAGMAPMVGDVALRRTDTAGRYSGTVNLSMAGDWRIDLKWSGPAGDGSTTLMTSAR